MSFGALVGLMVLGTDEPAACAGEVRSRNVRVVDERYPAQPGEVVETHPQLGPVAIEEHVTRVQRRGPLCRYADTGGTVWLVAGTEMIWHRDRDTGTVSIRPRGAHVELTHAATPVAGLPVGGPRPTWSHWDGVEYTRPDSAVTATQFLGRDAWTVTLRPPARKKHPLELVVDAATGIVLAQTLRGLGARSEWTSLEIGVELDDAVFAWDGPQPGGARPSAAETAAARAADDAVRARWLADHGIHRRPLPVAPELHLLGWDDDGGAFHLTFDASVQGSLLRRPRADGPWAESEALRWPNVWRWSDERWDWCCGSEPALTDDQRAVFLARLGDTT